jgi:predicted ester cyclase
MSTQHNKAVLARWLAAVNERNLEKLDELADETYTNDYVLHDPDLTGLPPGPAGVRLFCRKVLPAIPDLHVIGDDVIAEGDKVAVRWTIQGTDFNQHTPVTLMVLSISRFVGGKIAEEWQLEHPIGG